MIKIYKWFEDGIAIVGFFIIIGIFFSPTILQGKLPVPSDSLVGLYHPWRDLYSDAYPRGVPFKNFLITDPVRQQIPWRKIAIDQWKEGKIPLWNPYNFSGAPLLANIQAAALYPLNILFFFFPFIDAWTVLIILQPLLAGLFMYWYLRSLALRPVAGLLGAIAWSFSGFNVAWLTWGTIGHVVLWLPLALLAIDKIVVKRTFLLWRNSVFWSCLLVFSLVTQFFAGHSQMSLYFILVVIAYGTTRILQVKERKKAALLFAFLLSFVALLTAIQWMPLLDWFWQSSRVIDGSDWTKEGWFIPWFHLVQFVAPDFFGNPTTLNYWGQWNYGEFIGYIGVLPLVFAIGAVLSGRSTMRLFWTGISAVALLFALPTPIAYFPFILKVPMLSSLQSTRLLFVVDFALAMLAAYGCHEFLVNAKKRRRIVGVALIGAALAIVWGIVVASRVGLLDPALRGSLEVSMRNLLLPTVLFFASMTLLIIYQRMRHVTMFRNIVTWSFVGLVSVDLLRFGWKFTPFTPQAYFFPLTASIKYLQVQQKPFRILSLDKRLFPPNVSAYYGIESIDGYDPLYDKRYEAFIASVARQSPDILPPYGFNRMLQVESVDSAILPLLNVRYVLSLEDVHRAFLKKVFQEGDTRIYEYTKGTPRAYLVEKSTVILRKSSIIETLHKISDYQKEAIVEKPIELVDIPLAVQEGVEITDYSDQQIKLNVYTSVKRLLVIANLYSPFWKAFIDGKITEIHRTNYIFQGIVVPAGEHSIELKVQPL